MTTDLSHFSLGPEGTIRQALVCIDRNLKGIVLVTTPDFKLLQTLTDGDIRRAILNGLNLESPLSKVMLYKKMTKPITAPQGTSSKILLKIMRDWKIRQIPLTNEREQLAGLVTLDELMPDLVKPSQAVIMAGGFGSRLYPLTQNLPKPMLKIGNRPIMEHIIEQLREAGIRQVHITTHFQSEKITEYFGDGKEFGVELNYVSEKSPLGTGGALGLLNKPTGPMLVINGDVLTRTDFKSMIVYHQEHEAAMTIAVRQYDLKVPYGVVECTGEKVSGIREKPVQTFFVNAGIYLLEPQVYRFIPNGERFDMTDLISWLIHEKQKVVSFPIIEYWLDIGQHDDYKQAQEDVKNGCYAERLPKGKSL